jgi:hypothetical protein
MNKGQPRFTSAEVGRRGKELYEDKIRALVDAGNHGRFLAIDIETGDYQLGDETLEACTPLLERNPDAQIYCLRIGYRAVDALGYHGPMEEV